MTNSTITPIFGVSPDVPPAPVAGALDGTLTVAVGAGLAVAAAVADTVGPAVVPAVGAEVEAAVAAAVAEVVAVPLTVGAACAEPAETTATRFWKVAPEAGSKKPTGNPLVFALPCTVAVPYAAFGDVSWIVVSVRVATAAASPPGVVPALVTISWAIVVP